MLAAAGPGTPGLLAQVSPLAEGQERHHQRARQRDHVAVQAALDRRLARRVAHEVGQAGQIGLAVERQDEGGLVGQHVLAELRRQRSQSLHQCAIALLVPRCQPRTGTHEVLVHLLEQAQLFRRQAQVGAPGVQSCRCARTGPHACTARSSAPPSARPSRAAPAAVRATFPRRRGCGTRPPRAPAGGPTRPGAPACCRRSVPRPAARWRPVRRDAAASPRAAPARNARAAGPRRVAVRRAWSSAAAVDWCRSSPWPSLAGLDGLLVVFVVGPVGAFVEPERRAPPAVSPMHRPQRHCAHSSR